jgi:hypothetical protein
VLSACCCVQEGAGARFYPEVEVLAGGSQQQQLRGEGSQ